jgi:putative exporter of polyketide antibiotics
MKKIVLIYGLIAGAIVGSMLLITMPLYESGALKFENGELLGYTTMVVALSLVFFGIKSYRDNHLGGSIKFGNAAKVGLLITLIASLLYAVSWEITYNNMKGDFIKQYSEKQSQKMKAKGASEAEIVASEKKMAEYGELYKNPIIRFAMTLMEIMPVGIIISLLSAALLRKKEFLPATPNN